MRKETVVIIGGTGIPVLLIALGIIDMTELEKSHRMPHVFVISCDPPPKETNREILDELVKNFTISSAEDIIAIERAFNKMTNVSDFWKPVPWRRGWIKGDARKVPDRIHRCGKPYDRHRERRFA